MRGPGVRAEELVRGPKMKALTLKKGLKDLQNIRNLAKAKALLVPDGPSASGSSVSDLDSYRAIVAAAARDEKVFHFFRSHPNYTAILDHVTRQQGREYLEILSSRAALPEGASDTFRAFSRIGGPQVSHYEKVGWVAPTLFRYLKVASDIRILFGTLEGMRIAEIGIGWGGQTWVLSELNPTATFFLYDLPEVNELASRALSRVSGLASEVTFINALEQLPNTHLDLLISNYAFSELNRANQQKFLDRVLSGSSRGYVTWNSLSSDGFSVQELLDFIPGSASFDEKPLTSSNNQIVAWGHLPDAKL